MYGLLPTIKLDGSDEEMSAFPIYIESSPTGPKTAAVRLPTNDELIGYLQSQKSVYRDLGRRTGQSEDVPNPKADQKLFRSIRLDANGPEFDDAEAARAIQMVTRHRVTDCVRDGDGYVISLSTPFGLVTHTVRIPWESEKAEYFREWMKVRDMPHGVEERRFPPEVPVRLYDKIVQEASGYLAYDYSGDNRPKLAQSIGGAEVTLTRFAVPPHHKRSVINELLSTLSSLDPDLSPNS